jgi:phage-related minor tail protein
LEQDRLDTIERITKAYEQQQRIQETLADAQRSIISQRQEVDFEGAQQGASPMQRQIAQIKESSRRAALEASRAFAAAFEDTGDGMSAERAKQLSDGLELIRVGYQGITDAQVKNLEASRTWNAGWKAAFEEYAENANNAAAQSRSYFETFTKGFEDAFVKFVQTGKLSFKDLANSMIADFARVQAKRALLGMFSGGGGGGILGSIGKIFGFANGGNPAIGNPILVGEKGPELMIPRNASTIIPNSQLGGSSNQTSVTYNIQAVDAQSFQSMLARDPGFLHAVAEKGRRSMPQGVAR